MKKVQDFLDGLLEKEQKAIDAGNYKKKFAEYNSYAKEIKSHMYDSTVGLGLPVLQQPKPDFFYEDAPYPRKRYLYKVSKYKHHKYSELWSCYMSVANPGEGKTKLLSLAFIAAVVEENLKIVAQFAPDYDTKIWEFRGGDSELDFYNLGELVSVNRIMSPENDDWSVQEYMKEM